MSQKKENAENDNFSMEPEEMSSVFNCNWHGDPSVLAAQLFASMNPENAPSDQEKQEGSDEEKAWQHSYTRLTIKKLLKILQNNFFCDIGKKHMPDSKEKQPQQLTSYSSEVWKLATEMACRTGLNFHTEKEGEKVEVGLLDMAVQAKADATPPQPNQN